MYHEQFTTLVLKTVSSSKPDYELVMSGESLSCMQPPKKRGCNCKMFAYQLGGISKLKFVRLTSQ